MSDESKYPSPEAAKSEPAAKKEAQKFCDRALIQDDSEKRLSLARKALGLDHRSADAHTIFAREVTLQGRWWEAHGYASEAVRAAEEGFDEGVRKLLAGSSHKLWRRKALRPYLRARAELARTVVGAADGEQRALQEAIEISRQTVGRAGFREGEGPEEIRTLEADLALWLVEAGRADEAFGILDNVEPDHQSAAIRYTTALAYVHERGYHSEQSYLHAATLFVQALAANPLIADLLLRKEEPGSAMLGVPAWAYNPDPREARFYALLGRRAWWECPGALSMLRDAREEIEEMNSGQVPVEYPTPNGSEDESPADPAEKARLLCREAFATEDPTRRLELARRAHSISERCADAYTLFATDADSQREAKQLAEKALSLARQDESPQAGESCLRAVTSLVLAERALGEDERAIEHCQEALALDRDDELGLSHILLHLLIGAWRDAEARQLLESYECDCVHWLYSWALVLYRAALDEDAEENPGDDPMALDALSDALCENPAVPDYLLGRSAAPAGEPSSVGMILEPEEAVAAYYTGAAYGAWEQTPGALSWLAGVEEEFAEDMPWDEDLDHERGEGRARLFCWREPDGEDPPLAAYKSALEALIHDRARLWGLRTEYSWATLNFRHYAAVGSAGQIARMAHEFLEDNVCDFHVLLETAEDLENFDWWGVEVSIASEDIEDPDELFG